MTVLVTGGAGFVGAFVVGALLDRHEKVVMYDLASESPALDGAVPGWRSRPELVTVRGSVTALRRLEQACRAHGADSIVHLASPLTGQVNNNLRRGLQDICVGTSNVLEVGRVLGLRRIVWASTISVFGDRARYGNEPLDEDSEIRPASFYGSCKALCEEMARQYRVRHGVDSIGLRLTIVYGPGRGTGVTSFLSRAIQDAAAGRPVRIPYGDQLLNWQYVQDVAEMILAALDAPTPNRTVFNTSGDARTLREAADLLSVLTPGCRPEISRGRFDGSDGLSDFPAYFDDSRLRSELGFRWRFDLERGLRDQLSAAKSAVTATAP